MTSKHNRTEQTPGKAHKRQTADAQKRGDAPDAKPDQAIAQNAEEAARHEHERAANTQEGSATPQDAEHGFTQDSGYAQSGGPRSEDVPRKS
jgi:hypothetical protein